MKRKINLVGNTFIYLIGGNKGYSVHRKESEYILDLMKILIES